MSSWGFDDNGDAIDGQPDTNENLQGPKPLRDAYDALKAKNEELQTGLAAVQKQLREQAVGATLTELGIPATAAEQYKGEADPIKVREWAESMKALFGGGQDTGTPTTSDAAPTNALDPMVQAQFQNMNDAGQQGTPLGNVEMAVGRVSDAKDLNALLEAWKSL